MFYTFTGSLFNYVKLFKKKILFFILNKLIIEGMRIFKPQKKQEMLVVELHACMVLSYITLLENKILIVP